MIVYAVLVNDRHADPDVEAAYTDERAAIEKAEELAAEYCRHPEDLDLAYELTDGMVKGGWVRHIPYSCEGDSITVIRVELRDAGA